MYPDQHGPCVLRFVTRAVDVEFNIEIPDALVNQRLWCRDLCTGWDWERQECADEKRPPSPAPDHFHWSRNSCSAILFRSTGSPSMVATSNVTAGSAAAQSNVSSAKLGPS